MRAEFVEAKNNKEVLELLKECMMCLYIGLQENDKEEIYYVKHNKEKGYFGIVTNNIEKPIYIGGYPYRNRVNNIKSDLFSNEDLNIAEVKEEYREFLLPVVSYINESTNEYELKYFSCPIVVLTPIQQKD